MFLCVMLIIAAGEGPTAGSAKAPGLLPLSSHQYTHNFLSASPHSPFCLPSRINKRKADKGRSYLLQQKLFEDCCADAELPAPPPFPILYAKGEEEAGIAEVSAQHRRIVSDVKNTTFLCKSSSC